MVEIGAGTPTSSASRQTRVIQDVRAERQGMLGCRQLRARGPLMCCAAGSARIPLDTLDGFGKVRWLALGVGVGVDVGGMQDAWVVVRTQGQRTDGREEQTLKERRIVVGAVLVARLLRLA